MAIELEAMAILKLWCQNNKTCDGCRMNHKHKGCYFRQNKTPREWKYDEINNKQ